MSPQAKQSKWIEREARIAQLAAVTIYPVLLSGSPGEAIPFYLIERHFIDARDDHSELSHLAEQILQSDRRQMPARQPIPPSREVISADELEPAPGTLWTEPNTGMEFVWVPAGTFPMGSDLVPEEAPSHVVRISQGTWYGRHPVINREYWQFAGGSKRAPAGGSGSSRFSGERQPVVGVTWYEARDFCKWLTPQLPAGWEADLPTEAEWEWATQGPQRRRYAWGDQKPDASLADFEKDQTTESPADVGTHAAGTGPFGAQEQTGTVWEWCKDHWTEYYTVTLARRVDPCHQTLDGQSAAGDIPRVVRGGCWTSLIDSLHCSARNRFPPTESDEILGFRVLCRLPTRVEIRHPGQGISLGPTLINNSRATTLREAVTEWDLRLMGYSKTGLSCQACGRKIKYYAHISNERMGAHLFLGLSCYERFREALHEAQIGNPFPPGKAYRRKRQELTIQRTLRELSIASEWELPEIDYGSWKGWFFEQERRGNLPPELSEGMEELHRAGFLASNDQVDQFVAFHNANRRFPSHVLLPYTRLRALYSVPHRVPLALTLDGAVRFSRWSKSRQELGPYIFDRLCRTLGVSREPADYRCVIVYNYIISLYRSYKGAANPAQREDFLYRNLLFLLNPAIRDLSFESKAPYRCEGSMTLASKREFDAEVQALTKLLAELVLPTFHDAAPRSWYTEMLSARIEHIAAAGHVPFLWPLASSPPPTPRSHEQELAAIATFRDLFQERKLSAYADLGLTVEQATRPTWPLPKRCSAYADFDLTVEARRRLEAISRGPTRDIIIICGWLTAPFCCSGVAMLLQRRATILAIGLNQCWKLAAGPGRAAIIDMILRDLSGKAADPDGVYAVHRFLSSVDIQSLKTTSPRQADQIFRRMDIDAVLPGIRENPPHLIARKRFRKVRYNRWSHSLFIPEALLGEGDEKAIPLPSELLTIAALKPPRLAHPRQFGGSYDRDAIDLKRECWYQTDWPWIQPEEGEIDFHFLSRYYCGLPSIFQPPSGLELLSEALGKELEIVSPWTRADEDELNYLDSIRRAWFFD